MTFKHNHPGSVRVALFATALLFSPVALLAQSAPDPGPPPPGALPSQNPSPAQQDSTGAPGMTGQMMRDKNFLRKAAEDGIAEIQFGQLATQKSATPEIKSFGEKVVTDRAEINQQISSLADSMGIMLPKKMSKDDQVQYDKLKNLAPADFDTQYIVLVTVSHRKELHDYREEIVATPDTALRDTVVKAGGVIREHTQMAEKIAKDKGITLPARPPRPTQAGTPPPPATTN